MFGESTAMFINGIQRPQRLETERSRTKPGGSAGFGALLATEGTAESAPAAGAAPVAPSAALGAMLAAQGVDDPLAERQRATREGHDMLDMLEAIRRGLVTGAIPRERLGHLLAYARGRRGSGDAALDDILAQIELRAMVELAKLGIAS